MKTPITTFLTAALLFAGTAGVFAGPYTDSLSTCVSDSATKKERAELAKWIFAAMASHPKLKPIASVSSSRLETANKQAADLVMELLTVRCVDRAKKAIAYEGLVALETSFQILGQLAFQETVNNPAVISGMSGFEKFLDQQRLISYLLSGLGVNK